jgi:hypothetical protein
MSDMHNYIDSQLFSNRRRQLRLFSCPIFTNLTRYIPIFLLLLGSFSLNSEAAVYTWDGGGATEFWSEANNWNPNSVPISADDIVFDGSFSQKPSEANISINLNRMTIQNNFTSTITIKGSVVVNSSITIPSGCRLYLVLYLTPYSIPYMI